MDDLVYNEIVLSPGYEMVFAVGTTYSLDAEVYLAMSLAFARLGDAGVSATNSSYRMLEGLRRANGRIAMFCNRGGLLPPKCQNPLHAMLDKTVFEVSDTRKGRELANFHPKVWIIKERDVHDHSKMQIRLVVLSRNLTRDSSLDVATAMVAPMVSNPSSETISKHRPLKDFLLALAPYASSEKKRDIKKLAADIDKIDRFVLSLPYTDYDFMPLHFGTDLNPEIDFRQDMPGRKMAVVSPFIDADSLSWLNSLDKSDEKVLVTRLDSLTPEIMQLYSAPESQVLVVSPVAEQNDIQPMNLHAKMYFSWRPRNGGACLWLGSANATHSGFHRNSEFLLRLTLKNGNRQFDDFKRIFYDEKNPLCRPVDSVQPMQSSLPDRTLERSVRQILLSQGNMRAVVGKDDQGYIVTITARQAYGIGGDIFIAPVRNPENKALMPDHLSQCQIHMAHASDLSEFYVLHVVPHDPTLSTVEMVIKIPTEGIPADRDDQIFRNMLNAPHKILGFVEMMITDQPQQLSMLDVATTDGKDGYGSTVPVRYTAIYESLLKTYATDPKRIDEIRDVIRRLDPKVVPSELSQIIESLP